MVNMTDIKINKYYILTIAEILISDVYNWLY